jgi:hypothetical protein
MWRNGMWMLFCYDERVRLRFLLFAGLGACLGPTEITLDVTTNVDCATGLREVDIYIGKRGEALTSPSAVASKCEDPTNDRVGTLVVLPSKIDETVDIAVVAVLTGANACTPNSTDSHCIVAKRSLGYISHTPLELPIFLDANCAGVSCPDNQTCSAPNGKPTCVDDTPTCSSSGGSATSCGLDGGTGDAAIGDADAGDGTSSDGGSSDAIPSDGIASDAPVACPSPALGLFTNPKYAWSFESTLAENANQLATQTKSSTTTFLTKWGPSCGAYVSTTLAQPLTATQQSGFAQSHFAIAAWIEGPAVTDANATIFALGITSQVDLRLQFVNGVLVGTWNDGSLQHTVTDSATLALGTWFSATLELDATQTPATLTLYRANAVVASKQAPFTNYAPSSGPLSVGATVGVDQLEFYALP